MSLALSHDASFLFLSALSYEKVSLQLHLFSLVSEADDLWDINFKKN